VQNTVRRGLPERIADEVDAIELHRGEKVMSAFAKVSQVGSSVFRASERIYPGAFQATDGVTWRREPLRATPALVLFMGVGANPWMALSARGVVRAL